MNIFEKNGIQPNILKALSDLGFNEATPIQEKCISFLLSSKSDLIGLSQTGTGKTAAFSLPIIQQIDPNLRKIQAIILCPTRELCVQITKDIEKYIKYLSGIKAVAIYGGDSIGGQISALRSGPQIVVGTPGRVQDFVNRKRLRLETVKWLVLDEADEMLSMGFKDELDAILAETPKEKQTLLFSATMPKAIEAIAKKYMKDPEEISAGQKNSGPEKVKHIYYLLHPKDRYLALKRIIDATPDIFGIVFCRTRRETQEVSDKLMQSHYSAEAIHGDLSQDQRALVMNRFRNRKIKLLIATDVAARGIDISNLSHVINFSLPDTIEAYLHRSGRTGRVDNCGISLSFINSRDIRFIRDIERKLGRAFERGNVPLLNEVYEKQLANFMEEITTVQLEESRLNLENVYRKLESYSKEEIIKLFLGLRFKNFLESYKNESDVLNSRDEIRRSDEREQRMSNIEFARFSINFGARHNFNSKELFRLINKQSSLKNVQVGKIVISNDISYFEIDKRFEERVQKFLKYENFRGEPVVLNCVAANFDYNKSPYNKNPYNRSFKKEFRKRY